MKLRVMAGDIGIALGDIGRAAPVGDIELRDHDLQAEISDVAQEAGIDVLVEPGLVGLEMALHAEGIDGRILLLQMLDEP